MSIKRDVDILNTSKGATVDSRNTIKHTFTTTGNETIRHKLGYEPQGATPIKRSAPASIYLISASRTEIVMQSSVANVTATILLI